MNSGVTVALCISALNYSGGFFNPILASALTLNCRGNNLAEHIFVYWLASLAGGIVARTIHISLRSKPGAPLNASSTETNDSHEDKVTQDDQNDGHEKRE